MGKLAGIIAALSIAFQASAAQGNTQPNQPGQVSAPQVSIASSQDRDRVLGVYYLLCREYAPDTGLGDFHVEVNECYTPRRIQQTEMLEK